MYSPPSSSSSRPPLARTQRHRSLAVQTPLEDDLLLLEAVRGTERLGSLFSYELDLLSESADVPLDELIGAPMSVRLPDHRGGERFVHGHIRELELVSCVRDLHAYRAQLVPWAWFLDQDRDCRIFQNASTPEILDRLLQPAGVRYELRLIHQYPQHDYRVQYQESSFAFASRLMEEGGLYYFFRHEAERHVLVITDVGNGAPVVHGPREGFEKLPFHDQDRTEPAGGVSDWRVSRSYRPTRYASTDFNYRMSRNDLLVVEREDDAEAVRAERFEFPGRHASLDQGERNAGVRATELANGRLLFQGRTNSRGICAGSTFGLTGHPREDQNTDYLVLESRLEAVSNRFESVRGGSPEIRFDCSFTAMRAADRFRPVRQTRKPIAEGPQTAIVTAPSGWKEEIATDEDGRIMVRFHWDREGEERATSSCMIRVAEGWAGSGFGTFFLPRVGQEVIVDFLEGDLDRPVVVGSLYNDRSRPPYELPKHATVSTIKSRTTPDGGGFNEIRFEDRRGCEQVFLHAQGRMDQRVRGSLYETTGGNREIRVGGKNGGDLNLLAANDVNALIRKRTYAQLEDEVHAKVDAPVKLKMTQGGEIRGEGLYTVKTDELELESDELDAMLTSMRLSAERTIEVQGKEISFEANVFYFGVGQNFIKIDPSGITIQGQTVRINQKPPLPMELVTDPSVAELGEIDPPLEALGAMKGLPCQGKAGGGGGGRRRGPSEPMGGPGVKLPKLERPKIDWPDPVPPPPPPPPPGEEVVDPPVCRVESIEAYCEHEPNGVRRAIEDEMLEVVSNPANIETDREDLITLNAEAVNCCGEHPLWRITSDDAGVDEEHIGHRAHFTTYVPKPWLWLSRTYPWNPDKKTAGIEYQAHCNGCSDEGHELSIRALPPDQVNDVLIYDDIQAYLPDVSGFVSENWDKLWNLLPDDVRDIAEAALPDIELEVALLSGESAIMAHWEECDDRRAYYDYHVKAIYQDLLRLGAQFKADFIPVAYLFKKFKKIGSRVARKVVDKLFEHKFVRDVLGDYAEDYVKKFLSDIEKQLGENTEARVVYHNSLHAEWICDEPPPGRGWRVAPTRDSYGMRHRFEFELRTQVAVDIPKLGTWPDIIEWEEKRFEFYTTLRLGIQQEPFIDEKGFGVSNASASFDGWGGQIRVVDGEHPYGKCYDDDWAWSFEIPIPTGSTGSVRFPKSYLYGPVDNDAEVSSS